MYRSLLLLCIVLIQVPVAQATSTLSTEKVTTEDTTQEPTSVSPTTPTTAPTTPTTAPSTTTTTAPTTAAPAIGGYCKETTEPDAWCNDTITGNAQCLNNVCACASDYMQLTPSQCIPVDELTPGNITVTPLELGSLNVIWLPPPAVTGHNISVEYTLDCTSTSGTNVKDVVIGTTGNCTKLTPGDVYNVTVTATYNKTYSRASTLLFPLEPAQPGKLNISASLLNAPDVTLVWTAANGSVDQYNITVGNMGAILSNTSSVMVTGLVPGTMYIVTITAISNIKTSESMLDSFRTETTVPSPPGTPSTTAVGKDHIELHWDPPTEPNGDIEGYNISINEKIYKDEAFHLLSWEFVSVTNLSVSNLTSGAFYMFEIFTKNDQFMSNTYGNLTVRTNESTPGNVTDLKVSVSNLSLIVTWLRPLHPNGDIIQYRLEWQTANDTCYMVMNTTNPVTNATTSSSSCNQNAAEMTLNQKSMEYTMTALRPYTNYTITVTAYTSVGAGVQLIVFQQTSILKPEAASNVKATVVNSTCVNVTWDISDTNPGPVTYTVMVEDLVLHNTTSGCQVQDFSSKSCMQTNLQEFWPYRFSVQSMTSAGETTSNATDRTTTAEGVPSEVTDISLFSSGSSCDVTKIKVSWTEPALTDRNANITHYVLESLDIQHINVSYPVKDPDIYNVDNRTFYTTLDELKAETETRLVIFARTQEGNFGQRNEVNFTTLHCESADPDEMACYEPTHLDLHCLPTPLSPPGWSDEWEISTVTATTSTITITVPREFFIDSKQGTITTWGLVVSTNKLPALNDSNVERSWKDSQASKLPYRIQPSELSIQSSRAETGSVEVTVGSNSACKSSSTGFCNAPLPENTQFYIMGFACTGSVTERKCSNSQSYGPFATLVQEDDDGDGWDVVGAILAFLFVLVVSISVFVFLWFRGVIDPPGWLKKPESELVNMEDIPPTPIVEHRPILLSNYHVAIMELHRDTNLLLSDQYGDISKLGKRIEKRSSYQAALMEANKPKNRWVNVMPFDHSRVKLQPIDDDDSTSDYINADYMPGFSNRREYIATQGPLPGTIDDFWRMVWEHNVKVVVMLTQCKEGNRVKCEQYWPAEVHEAKQYGDVVVNPISISPLDKYNITIFELIVNEQKRLVSHFHYLDFPDMTANVEFDSFIEFVHIVRSHVPHDMVGPMVIHCSAGVGRTGTFIILDHLNQYLASPEFSWDSTVDIFSMVMSLRENRVLMVQTESQYIMIHDCLSAILEQKKAALACSMENESLHDNQAFDPYPEVLYENVLEPQMKTLL